MRLREVVYGAYERRLVSKLPADRLPKHVGAIVDGNRRWARDAGAGVHGGYQAGADKISEFLAKVGRVKVKPDNWKDYYFGDVDKLTD